MQDSVHPQYCRVLIHIYIYMSVEGLRRFWTMFPLPRVPSYIYIYIYECGGVTQVLDHVSTSQGSILEFRFFGATAIWPRVKIPYPQ